MKQHKGKAKLVFKFGIEGFIIRWNWGNWHMSYKHFAFWKECFSLSPWKLNAINLSILWRLRIGVDCHLTIAERCLTGIMKMDWLKIFINMTSGWKFSLLFIHGLLVIYWIHLLISYFFMSLYVRLQRFTWDYGSYGGKFLLLLSWDLLSCDLS